MSLFLRSFELLTVVLLSGPLIHGLDMITASQQRRADESEIMHSKLSTVSSLQVVSLSQAKMASEKIHYLGAPRPYSCLRLEGFASSGGRITAQHSMHFLVR